MKCTSCGFDNLEVKKINHIITGGFNTASIETECEVCCKCKETYFTPEQIKQFEVIREKLKNNQTEGFIPIGKNYKVA